MTYKRDEWAWRKQEYRRRLGKAGRKKRNDDVKIYQKTHRGRLGVKAASINTTAKFRGVKGKVFGRDLLNIINAQGGALKKPCQCAVCGNWSEWMDMTWDHIYPIAAGGKNARSNIQLLCKRCHTEKSGRERTALGSFGSGLEFAESDFIDPQLTLKI